MEQHLEYYVLCLIGTLIHYLKDWVNHQKNGVKYGWQKALPTMLLSVVTTQLLVYLREDINDLYVITPFSSVILGYFGNSIFFTFVDAKKPAKTSPDENTMGN